MTVRPLLALVVLAALVVAPLAQAGDHGHPEIADPGDDVQVNDGANCGTQVPPGCAAGMDFFWHNADLELVWVNDTVDAIVFTMELRASEGFSQDNEGGGPLGRADDFTYTYTFAFTVSGVPYTAVAILDDALGVTTGGVAATASISGRDLTVTVAKSALQALPLAGDHVSGLSLTMHGASSVIGVTLDDRAPDANAGPDYVLAASPAGNMTGNGTDNEGEPGAALPGVTLPVFVAVLAAIAVALRRRE